MPDIEARVYSGLSPGTLIATLDDAFDKHWVDQFNDPGSGDLMVGFEDDVLDAHPSILNCGNIVRYNLLGADVFAFVIEDPEIPPGPESERVEHAWKVEGRGVMALLDRGVVLPEAYVEGSLATKRAFDWTAIFYDDSSWIAATQIQRQDATTGPIPDYVGFPLEWPDPTAYWIFSRVQAAIGDFLAGVCYFRGDFTLAAATQVILFVTADNGFRVWVDNEVVIEDWPSDEGIHWRETRKVELLLGPGVHQIAVEVINHNLADGTPSPGALLLAVLENVDGLPGPLIFHTDSSWVCLDYPATVPGMSVGQILRILIEEAQARGSLPGITLGFTDTTDSKGAPWATEPDLTLDIGTNLLDVIFMFIEQWVDSEMTYDLELLVYNKGTQGADKTETVQLQVAVDFEALEASKTDLVTNAILARNSLGELTLREDATSLGLYPRKEVYVEFGTAPNIARAQAMADEVFIDYSHPTVEITGRVTAESGPYSDYVKGDTIEAPDPVGVAAPTTVLSISVEEDEAGHAVYTAEGAQDAAA